MYSVVLMVAMTSGGDVAAHHNKGGCGGGCFGSCYGGCGGGFFNGHRAGKHGCGGGGFLGGLFGKHRSHGCNGCYGGCVGNSCSGYTPVCDTCAPAPACGCCGGEAASEGKSDE